MDIVLIIVIGIFILGVALLGVWFFQSRKLGVLKGNKIYTDTESNPGEILYAKSVALSGKPDYLIKEGDMVYPVEVKTGKTPASPYLSHTTQLMAYCLLVEENYGVRPTGGILKYPEKEFKIAYTDEAKQSLVDLVGEMILLKHSGKELDCNHKNHYL